MRTKIEFSIDWGTILGMTSYVWVLACLGAMTWELNEMRLTQTTVDQTQCLVFEGNIRCMTWKAGNLTASVTAGRILHRGDDRPVKNEASAILVEEL